MANVFKHDGGAWHPTWIPAATKAAPDLAEIADLTAAIHAAAPGLIAAASGVNKFRYTSPTTGQVVHALLLTRVYGGDSVWEDVWHYDGDFTVDDAVAAIRAEQVPSP